MVLNDGMTSVLRKISGALTTTLDAFEQMQRASGQSINSAQFAAARSQLVGANAELDKMADNFQKAGSKADGLMGKISGIAAGIASTATVQKLVTLSNDVTSAQARLNLLVTDGGSVDELEAKIMASANRSRSAYLDTASAVAKLGLNAGNAFDHDMDQVIAFMEQVNKQFVIGGATAQEQSSAMVQLTQAMAAGALRGEELNSILDSAPGIARAIEQYMGVAEGSIKEYAAEGKVTAQVVKNALFSVADETNAKFESMPMTWAQVWTMMSNIALQALEPVLTFINWLANNIEIIGPLVLGVAAALAVYLIATKGVAAATKVWTAVQTAFNAVMALNPVFLIIMGIILLIALIYAVVAAVNRVTGASTSATGIICGAVLVLAAIIGNTVIGLLNAIIQFIWSIFVEPFLGIIEWILNVCNGGFNSFGDAVANLIGNIISWFLSLGKVVTKIIDAIFGTDWTGGLNALQDKVLAWGKNENSITLDREAPTIDHRFEYGDAWSKGYDFGAGVEDKIGGMFNMGDGSGFDMSSMMGDGSGFDMSSMMGDGSGFDMSSMMGDGSGFDMSSMMGDGSGFDMSSMMGDVGSIAGDTGSIADSLSVTDEELEYLRDIAERDAINRFTTAEVKIDMTGMTNKIDGSADIDGIITELTDGFTEALVTAAEGVHE
jgi:tape measure domain-containing protein